MRIDVRLLWLLAVHARATQPTYTAFGDEGMAGKQAPIRPDVANHTAPALRASLDGSSRTANEASWPAGYSTGAKTVQPAGHIRQEVTAKTTGAGALFALSTMSTVEKYGLIFLIMVTLVAGMYYKKGVAVVLEVVLYISCLALIKISLKSVYSFGWNHPQFLTAMHLLASSIVGFSILEYRHRVLGMPRPRPSKAEFYWGILPIAISFGVSIGAENGALLLV
eukprot:TRINITY_DN27738_c0_g1_i2.p1 TRINITY_DN27738_c0_g1~~TRINITY_DN27738_c0_g1_i2.p1  ORF type:complete len:223 (+),score=22.21 TRINITY_DN27738_c0_g1_i2:99-767(+)